MEEGDYCEDDTRYFRNKLSYVANPKLNGREIFFLGCLHFMFLKDGLLIYSQNKHLKGFSCVIDGASQDNRRSKGS